MRLLNKYNKLHSRLNLFPLQIKDKEKENDYRENYIDRNLWHFRPFLLSIGIIYFLFIIPDFLYIHNNVHIKLLLFLRIVFLAMTISIYFWSKFFLDYDRIFYTTTMYELTGFSIFLIIAYIYNPFNFTIHFLGLLIIILGIFFIVPNKFIIKIVISILFSLAFYVVSFLKITPDQVQLIAFIVYNFLIIFICAFSEYRINYLQRLNYLINKKLERLSITDALTGIYNRFKFDRELEKQIDYVKRYKSIFSLVMFDIDDFKEINDEYGHLTGDKVLAEIADIVRNEIRKIDIFARIGGEEFVIILPNTDLEETRTLSERLRRKISNYKFPGNLEVSCSFGVTEYQNDDKNSLIQRVDNLLYQAKDNGKNCVIVQKNQD